MKRAAFIFFSLLLAASISAQSADSSKFYALGQKLEEYYAAMKHESLAYQEAECDFLIETATDSLVRQYVAQNIYGHFMDSPLMGSENVAIHVFDRWFSDGKLAMSSPEAFADAKVYADFNRQSLIGRKAPSLELESPDGRVENLFGPDAGTGKFSVIFFYDADCPKCKLQIRLLNALFSRKNYPVDLYAVYVGDDRQKWTCEFSNLPEMMAHHLWDPALTSDFQRKYGVTQTPRMFLIDPDGTIVGRGLDAMALETMLDGIFAPKEIVYGGKDSEALFDGIFADYHGNPTIAAVKGIADYIHDRTLVSGDTLMFKQLSGDYLYYLSGRYGEGFKEGLGYHIDKNILFRSDIWRSSDDSLKVVGFAGMMSDLLSKAVPGSRIPSIKVPGDLYSWRGGKKVTKRLDRLGGDENIIIFHTEGCDVCAVEKAAALQRMREAGRTRNIKVFMVNMDSLMVTDPSLASRLMDRFDLSSLPFIVMADSKGYVRRRYVSLQK